VDQNILCYTALRYIKLVVNKDAVLKGKANISFFKKSLLSVIGECDISEIGCFRPCVKRSRKKQLSLLGQSFFKLGLMGPTVKTVIAVLRLRISWFKETKRGGGIILGPETANTFV